MINSISKENNMLDLNILSAKDITVKNLNVYGNPMPIIPPDVCHCRKGMRLYSRFFYIVSGEMLFDKGTEKELRAVSGDIVYLPYDIEYESEWTEPGSFLTANFIINDPSVVFSDRICIAVNDSSGGYLRSFRRLLDIWTKGAFNSGLKALSVFMDLLSDIAEETSRSGLAGRFSDISDGIMQIESRFYEDISVEELARMCSVSPATFRRKFRHYSEYSPITYRNYLRCKRAKELMESGEYNVTEASLAVGFDDLSYFNRVFVRFFGENPSVVAKK